jgi:hypothetical protein
MEIKITKKPHWTHYVLIGGLIILAILLYKGCANSKSQLSLVKEKKAEIDSLLKVQNEIRTNNDKVTAYYKQLESAAAMEAFLARRQVASKDSALKGTQAVAARLSRKLKEYEVQPTDTVDAFIVSKDYVKYCDSCGEVIPVLNAQIDGYRKESEAKDKILESEVVLHQSEVARLTRVSDSIQSVQKALQGAYGSIIKATKQRLQVYGGLSLGAWPQGVIWGAQARMRTKSGGQMYGLKYLNIQKQNVYMAEVDFLLSFRKKR